MLWITSTSISYAEESVPQPLLIVSQISTIQKELLAMLCGIIE
jgi:hypothetical protein